MIRLCVFFSFFFSPLLAADAGITYTFSGGQFGDNLIAYLHAKWVSYAYNIPLYYKPFPDSEALKLERAEPFRHEKLPPSAFTQTIRISNLNQIEPNPEQSTLFVIPYFPDYLYEFKVSPHLKHLIPYFKIEWEDKEFQKIIRSLIKPREKLKTVYPKKGTVGIAVHIRSAHGKKEYIQTWPQKFPPNQFYITQLRYLCRQYRGKKIHVHIFTDHPHPEELARLFKKHISSKDLTFTWDGSKTPLEDFFSLQNFDCLIRPESNFSFVAGKLKDFAFEISPAEHRWEGDKLIIHKVTIIKHNSLVINE